jgi:hypothetical protein
MSNELKDKLGRANYLLDRALSEIRHLRKDNQMMHARLDMFDAVMSALHGQPARQGGGVMAPDIEFDIQKHIENENT